MSVIMHLTSNRDGNKEDKRAYKTDVRAAACKNNAKLPFVNHKQGELSCLSNAWVFEFLRVDNPCPDGWED